MLKLLKLELCAISELAEPNELEEIFPDSELVKLVESEELLPSSELKLLSLLELYVNIEALELAKFDDSPLPELLISLELT